MIRRNFVTAVVLAGLAGSAVADTIRVPQDHKTIQAAIDAAATGDIVLVEAGTYRERVHLKDGMTLKSAGDDAKGKLGLMRAAATIIDGGGKEGEGPGVAMAEDATLDGFTVTNVGAYDDPEWNKHHATQGNLQPHEHIGKPGTAGIGVIGVTCTIKNNIVHHIGYSGIAIQGVAGIRSEGVVRVTSNTFDCPALREGGGPPQFAVWGLPGSDIVFNGNTVRGWRHALSAEKATVTACNNRIANYGSVAIKIDQPAGSLAIIGNVFESDRDRAGVTIVGGAGIVENNRIVPISKN